MSAIIAPVMLPVAGSAFVRPITNGDGIRLYGASSGYVGLKPASAAGSTDYTLPSSPPSVDGQVLIGTTAGVLSWTTISTGLTVDSTPITGGGSGRILFESASGKVSESANLTWDGTYFTMGTFSSLVDWSGSYKQYLFKSDDAGNQKVYITPRWTNGEAAFRTNGSTFSFTNYLGNLATIYAGAIGVNKSSSLEAQLHVAAGSASTVGHKIDLASGQTANALEINSYGGSGGDKFKVASDGSVTIGGNSLRYGGSSGPLFQWNGSNVQLDRDFTVVAKMAVEAGATNSVIRLGPWPYTAGVGYSTSGTVEVNNGTTGTYRDLKLRHLIATGQAYCPQQTLTDAASISWDLDTQPSAVVTLADNRTLAAPTNQKAGATYILIVKQDATGSRTLTFDAVYKFAGGTAPTLTTTANAVDILTFVSDGTYMYGVAQNDLR